MAGGELSGAGPADARFCAAGGAQRPRTDTLPAGLVPQEFPGGQGLGTTTCRPSRGRPHPCSQPDPERHRGLGPTSEHTFVFTSFTFPLLGSLLQSRKASHATPLQPWGASEPLGRGWLSSRGPFPVDL